LCSVENSGPRIPSSLAHVRRFATWLDAGIRVPGTSLRFGLDPILGLVPGLGDAAGALLAGWLVVEALRLGVSPSTVGRMVLNVAVDAAVGAVPVLGDLFDFAWKANLRNVALLERHAADPAAAGAGDRMVLVLVAGGALALCAGLAVGGVLLGRWLIR
jgi:uncharacterized protein DUF4112